MHPPAMKWNIWLPDTELDSNRPAISEKPALQVTDSSSKAFTSAANIFFGITGTVFISDPSLLMTDELSIFFFFPSMEDSSSNKRCKLTAAWRTKQAEKLVTLTVLSSDQGVRTDFDFLSKKLHGSQMTGTLMNKNKRMDRRT